MKRIKAIIIAVILIVIVLTIAYFSLNYSKEGEALIATNFVKNEATFRFDGIPESFKLIGTVPLPCQSCWEFHFGYQSRNSGYGDRGNEVVNPLITDHTAVIVIEKGVIKKAVLDDKYDMKTQKLIEVESIPTNQAGRRR